MVDQSVTSTVATSMQAKDLAEHKELEDFLKNQSKQTHYTFQLNKCSSCQLCMMNSPHLPEEAFESVSFLSDPMLDETRERYTM